MTVTATVLLQWEEKYILATKVVTAWLQEAGNQDKSIVATTQESEAWIREAASVAVALNRLPAAVRGEWEEAMEARRDTVIYWELRIELWDVQRKDWVSRHYNFLLA